MPHYFIPPAQIGQGRFTLAGDEAHHLIRVLRVKAGAHIDLFDGTGRQFHALVEQVHEGTISGSIESESTAVPCAARVHLYCAVPKGDRFDWLVEKCAELGVAEITPIITERSVQTEIQPAKIERWSRLALAASKQSGRADIVVVHAPCSFADAVKHASPAAIRVIPWEGEESRPLSAIPIPAGSSVVLCIGPEGGFSLAEVDAARTAGITPVTLGPSILRVETAALVAATLTLAQAGQFSHNK